MTIQRHSEVGNIEADLDGGIDVQQLAVRNVIDSAVAGNDAGAVSCGIVNTEGGVVAVDAQGAVVDNDPNNGLGTDACGA